MAPLLRFCSRDLLLSKGFILLSGHPCLVFPLNQRQQPGRGGIKVVFTSLRGGWEGEE